MSRKYAFTTAAMAAALEDTPVSYEDLADIEREFDDVETEIIRQQVTLSTPLYIRRQQTVSQIPNFWPLVLEQAPPDIDQFIQPSDSALLLSSLTSLSVTHFEIDDPKGDPRSVSIKWEFAPNEYFEDKVLEKKFWYRRAADGWAGLVSEPVKIEWKKGKDLTGSLGDLVYKAWEIEQKENASGKKGEEKGKKELRPEQQALKKKIENTGMGGLSFFAWFGFIGRRITAEESQGAVEKERQSRLARKDEKRKADVVEDKLADEEEGDEEDVDLSLEIFPDGDELALAIADDLWPGAIKYFTQAQEQDALSDADFESDDVDSDDEPVINSASDSGGEDAADTRPVKKQRSS